MTGVLLILSLFSQVWLARRFGPNGIGEYSATTLFLTVVSVISALGMPIVTTRRVASAEQERQDIRPMIAAAMSITAVQAIGAAVIAWASWPLFSYVARIPVRDAAPLVPLAAAVLVLQYLGVSILMGRLRFTDVTLIAAVQPLAVMSCVALSYAEVRVDGVLMGVTGATATGLAGIAFLAVQRAMSLPHGAEVRSLMSEAIRGFGVVHVSLVASWIDRAVAAFVAGPAGLGAFAVASSATESALRISRTTGTFGVAAYARLRADPVGALRVLDSHVRLGASVFLVMGASVASGGGGLLALIFGPGFVPAVTTLQLLGVALLPMGLTYIVTSRAAGAVGLTLSARSTIALVIVQATASLVGALLFSIAGIALASVLVWTLALIVHTQASVKAGELAAIVIARPILVSVPVLAIALMLGRAPLPLFVQLSVGTSIAVAASLAFLITRPEWRLIRRLVAD